MKKSVTKNTWKMVEEFYKTNFNVGEELLDLLYSFPVLESYAKGIGVYSIMNLTELDKDEIIRILEKYFGTWVFVEDLIFSPIDIYDVCSGNEIRFRKMIEDYQGDDNNDGLNIYLFRISNKFSHLRERIKEYERQS